MMKGEGQWRNTEKSPANITLRWDNVKKAEMPVINLTVNTAEDMRRARRRGASIKRKCGNSVLPVRMFDKEPESVESEMISW